MVARLDSTRNDASVGGIRGGQQRMSLARAITASPRVLLLLGEPFSNVDVHSGNGSSSRAMRDAGKRFSWSHQAALLSILADEFLWMQAGRMQWIAPRAWRGGRPAHEGSVREHGSGSDGRSFGPGAAPSRLSSAARAPRTSVRGSTKTFRFRLQIVVRTREDAR